MRANKSLYLPVVTEFIRSFGYDLAERAFGLGLGSFGKMDLMLPCVGFPVPAAVEIVKELGRSRQNTLRRVRGAFARHKGSTRFGLFWGSG